MTINNLQRYIQNLWDWSFLKKCFNNPRISVTDLDGAVERNGYLLILETKEVGVDLSGGQKIAFSNLCKTGLTTVIVIWGDPQQPQAYQVYHQGRIGERKPCNITSLCRLVTQWDRWTSTQPPAWTLVQKPARPQFRAAAKAQVDDRPF